MRATSLILLGAVTALVCTVSAPAAVATPAAAPLNVVVILADDMGWNQVGYHGSSYYETPHIDRLARSGVQFSDAYSAAPICSPTRAALMSGKSPARLRLTDYIPGRKWEDKPLVTPNMTQGLPLAERTLPERLKERGYVTGLFGKWHLAPDYEYRPHRPMDPESQGFDVVFHTRKPEDEDIKAGKPDAHNADEITDHALKFIRAQRRAAHPFFCYVAHNVVHTPLGESEADVARFKARPGAGQPENHPVMAAMIARMDRNIGRILDLLDSEGLTASTLVIFASDNGNIEKLQRQTPFRGGKATLWEGGIRVPLAIRWPGTTQAGRVSAEPVITNDLFFTVLEAAGVKAEPGLTDGRSLATIATRGGSLGRDALFWHYPHYHHLGDMRPATVIRAGRYKLIEWHEGALLGKGPAVSLYDLSVDRGESRDLAPLSPQVAADLHGRLRAWRRSVDAQEMTVRTTPAAPAARP